jgi:hypothetical protein
MPEAAPHLGWAPSGGLSRKFQFATATLRLLPLAYPAVTTRPENCGRACQRLSNTSRSRFESKRRYASGHQSLCSANKSRTRRDLSAGLRQRTSRRSRRRFHGSRLPVYCNRLPGHHPAGFYCSPFLFALAPPIRPATKRRQGQLQPMPPNEFCDSSLSPRGKPIALDHRHATNAPATRSSIFPRKAHGNGGLMAFSTFVTGP